MTAFSADLTPAGRLPVFAVDAGGTATRVYCAGSRATFESVNPASSAATDVARRWVEIFQWICRRGEPASAGLVATASVGDPRSDHAVATIRDAAATAGLTGDLAVSNDVTPLLLGSPLHGDGFVVVAGTGSACLAGTSHGTSTRVGGHEYLLSDEGSAYQLGLAGLRAALRGCEGTGPGTTLSNCHPDLYAHARHLAVSPRAKVEVASFAIDVLACAQAGDRVATALVAQAVADLHTLVRTAACRLDVATRRVVLAGSMFAHSPEFAAQVMGRLRADEPRCEVTVVPDALEPCLSLVRRWPWSFPRREAAPVVVVRPRPGQRRGGDPVL